MSTLGHCATRLRKIHSQHLVPRTSSHFSSFPLVRPSAEFQCTQHLRNILRTTQQCISLDPGIYHTPYESGHEIQHTAYGPHTRVPNYPKGVSTVVAPETRRTHRRRLQVCESLQTPKPDFDTEIPPREDALSLNLSFVYRSHYERYSHDILPLLRFVAT
jgi:hypothetical protein